MTRIGSRRLLIATVILICGCGQQYKLPPAPDPGKIPTPGTYNLDRVWTVPAPTDILLRGGYVYVIEENARIGVYFAEQRALTRPSQVSDFEGLIHPVQIAIAKSDSTFLYVADIGDSSIKRYYFRGGPVLSSFTYDGWRATTGLAADVNRNVYIAEADANRIISYDKTGTHMRIVSSDGNGSGFVRRPCGLFWVNSMLWTTAPGQTPAQVKSLKADTTNTSVGAEPIGWQSPMGWPADVTTDVFGEYVFVADQARGRVLKFTAATGALKDSVYTKFRAETRVDPPIDAPRYVAADHQYVFIPDSAGSRIVVVKLGVQG
jgi:hypothetical protein